MNNRTKCIKKSIKIKYSKENKDFYNLLCNHKKKIIKKFELQIHKLNNSEIPIRFKILALPISFKEKSVLITFDRCRVLPDLFSGKEGGSIGSMKEIKSNVSIRKHMESQ